MTWEKRPVAAFVEEMAQREIPSPAAGSSLALTLAMACSLAEMVLSELSEKEQAVPGRETDRDWAQVRAWRQQALTLIDADIFAVERMIRLREKDPDSLLQPMFQLFECAGQLGELLLAYLDVENGKISDTVAAVLHVRTVWLGSAHILRFNARTFGWPLGDQLGGWEKRLRRWDRKLEEVMGGSFDGGSF
jgi:hypothetical protein